MSGIPAGRFADITLLKILAGKSKAVRGAQNYVILIMVLG